MRKPQLTAVSLILGSMLFSSCIGSFGTWNQLKNWNDDVEDKFMNKCIYYAAHIIPVYEICYLSDILVLNPIEYWNGMNPIAEAESIQIIKSPKGMYSVITNDKGYTIIKKGDEYMPLYLLFDSKDNNWSAIINGRIYEIVQKNESGTITTRFPDGTYITINPNEEGKKTIILAEDQKLTK